MTAVGGKRATLRRRRGDEFTTQIRLYRDLRQRQEADDLEAVPVLLAGVL